MDQSGTPLRLMLFCQSKLCIISYPGAEFLSSAFSIARSVAEPRGDMTCEIAMIFRSTTEIMRVFRRLEQADGHILGINRSGPCCLKQE